MYLNVKFDMQLRIKFSEKSVTVIESNLYDDLTAYNLSAPFCTNVHVPGVSVINKVMQNALL